MEIREILQNQHEFFLKSDLQFFGESKKLAQAQKVNNDGAVRQLSLFERNGLLH